MEKRTFEKYCVAALFLLMLAPRSARAAPTGDEILKKVREAHAALTSWSYIVYRTDIKDGALQLRLKTGLSSYQSDVDAFTQAFSLKEKETAVDVKRQNKEGAYTYLYVKPFIIQMTMDKSDYVPPFLLKSQIVYRPDIDPKKIYLKFHNTNMFLGKPADTETGGFMDMNWTADLMQIDCALANGGKLSAAGADTYNGKRAWLLDLTLSKGKIPWQVGCGVVDYGVPSPAYGQINRDFKLLADRIDAYSPAQGRFRYWVDADRWILLKEELLFGDKLVMSTRMENIELNALSAGNLLRPIMKKPTGAKPGPEGSK